MAQNFVPSKPHVAMPPGFNPYKDYGDEAATTEELLPWLEPDRKELETFVRTLFKYATSGWVSLRAFYEGDTRVFNITPVKLNGNFDALIDEACRGVDRAANASDKIVFCPPVATFANRKHAREIDLAEGLALTVECDKHAQDARARLEELLGPTTIVVESGGEWTDAETGEVDARLHLHFRLKAPARGTEALVKLKEVRKLATEIVGSDASNVPLVHPIRWPGSWHRKGDAKLCRIVAVNPEAEIDLDNTFAILSKAIPTEKSADNKFTEYGAESSSTSNWGEMIGEVLSSDSYHEPLTRLAAKLLAAGMNDGAAVNVLQGLMENAIGPHDARWKARYNDISRAVSTARAKFGEARQQSTLPARLMQSSAEFVAGFVPPDYLIDGLLQRRFVYSITAPTGSGKTAIAMLIAVHVAEGIPLAGREVEKGRVLFFAGENPDDVRTRWIKLCEEMKLDPDKVDVVFMPFTLDLIKLRQRIDAEASARGPFSLLIVDTSAAYYSGNDENDNVQLGNHARSLRSFVDLPGGPTVLVTCHPTKTPDKENLLPRGGGAFLAEVDGNLVCIKDASTMVVEVTTHGKFRGPEFAPFSFKLVRGQSNKLVDSKGRSIWTVFARSITNAEQEAIEEQGQSDQDQLLRLMPKHPHLSLAQLAECLGWLTMDGQPNKTAVHRLMLELKASKLVEMKRKRYALTNKGMEEAEQLQGERDGANAMGPKGIKPKANRAPRGRPVK